MRLQQKPHLFFNFIVNQFHVKLTKKCLYLSEFFGIKSKTGWWFHGWNWHKIMKPPDSVGKKNWNWRHLALPRPSVSFFFSLSNLDGFRILASFIHETTASFTFELKNQKKYRPFSSILHKTDHKNKNCDVSS